MYSLLRKDRVFLFLFLNAILVILGYALAVATGMASVGIMKIIRILFLFLSIGWIFLQKDWRVALKATKYSSLIIGLCLLLPAYAFISKNILDSLNRTQSFLIPFVYIWLSINILIYRYGQKEVLRLLSKMILMIYAIPMLSYVIFGGEFSGESIYGQSEEMVFVSNHFGWSAALFLIASFSAGTRKGKPLLLRLVFAVFLLLAIYLLIVSGSRSSMLSVALSLVIILFYYKGIPLYQKILIVISPFLLVSYLISTKNDAVMFVIERTERKLEDKSEGRMARLQTITTRMSESPSQWITGVGLFNYSAFFKEGKGIANYHNSYYELLFGLGIPVFLLFMVFMLYEPGRQFIKRVSKYDLLLIPLVLIPFFESNLTGGQFLFFPWFIYIFALNAKKKFAFFGTRNWFQYINPKQFEVKNSRSAEKLMTQ